MELVWRGSDGAENRLVLSGPGGIVGRAPRAEFCVPHRSISRRHARLEPLDDGSWRILDLGSRNGVIVRSRRVDEAILAPGDLIQLGDIVFTLEGSVDPELEELLEEECELTEPEGDPEPAAQSASAIVALLDTDLELEPPPLKELPRKQPQADDLLAREALAEIREVASARAADSRAPESPRETDPPVLAIPDLARSRTEPEGIFRASERWILVSICLLLLATTLILAFGPDREAPDAGGEKRAASPSSGVDDTPTGDEESGPAGAGAIPPSASLPSRTESPSENDASPDGPGGLTTAVASLPDLAALRSLAAAEVEESWCAATFLFGRAPTPEEMLLYAREGATSFLATARGTAEHWRARAERTARTTSLPAALLPDEVPLDLALWSGLVETLAGAERTVPLPAADGSDDLYEEQYRAALSERPRIEGTRNALRSVWTAGAGRPLDPEVEGWIDEMVRSQIPPRR